jgi:hypothetical protein
LNGHQLLVYKGVFLSQIQRTSMKHLFVFLTLMLSFCCLYLKAMGQKAEKVYPLTRVINTEDYYLQQAALWADTLVAQPQSGSAWFNYYTSARNYNVLNRSKQFDLDQIIQQAAEHITGTFEYHYLSFWQSPLQNREYSELFRAHQIAPDRPEAFHDLITYYELQGDEKSKQAYCQKWFETQTLSPGILTWNYNALMSVEHQSILLTQGDNSTYPAWVLQEVLDIRTDVLVLNLHMLLFDNAYRANVFSELGIEQTLVLPAGNNLEVQQSLIVEHLAELSGRPVYLGISVSPAIRDFAEDKLYLTGLAFLHSQNNVDNIALIRRNMEQKFRLDDLYQPLSYDFSQSVVDYINLNYIPSLILLYQHYESTDEQQKAERMKQLAAILTERSGKKTEVLSHFKPAAEPDPRNTHFDLKTIDKNLVFLKDNKYAHRFETSNAEYEAFLKDLLQQRAFDLLEKCRINQVDWVRLLPEEYQNQPDEVLFEVGHPEDPDMPIVNISYEAAQHYCEWLTKIYNQSDFRRKKFNKVRFYLPSESEWEAAANSLKNPTPFPWGAYTYKNSKGCYLANVNPFLSFNPEDQSFEKAEIPESPGEDGAYFPAKVDAYFPNRIGLYNMSGNVAEMTEGGVYTKGGSWLDPVDLAKLDSRYPHLIPSPAVGFRIFMEVIKE